ncbi:MAG: hypothetical protein QXW00_04305 [Candidatus Woesearchaeota archaeon]
MEAEKSIVKLWLESRGFFTISDINAGKSVIDILAVKFSGREVEQVQHIEVSCSLKGELPISEYRKRFDGPGIRKRIAEVLREYASSVENWEDVLVTNASIASESLEGVKVVQFSSVLQDVMSRLDTQNYQNNTLRTLQLVKYTYLRPDLIRSLKGKKFRKALKSIAIEHLSADEVIKRLSADESAVERILRRSNLRSDTKRLGSLLKRILTTAERKALSEEIMTSEQKRRRKVKEKKLSSFL